MAWGRKRHLKEMLSYKLNVKIEIKKFYSQEN